MVLFSPQIRLKKVFDMNKKEVVVATNVQPDVEKMIDMKISGRTNIGTLVYLDWMGVENLPSSLQFSAGNFPF